MFIDPAGMPQHLQAALTEQSGLPREKALQIARLYESLRAETPEAREQFYRTVVLDDASGLLVRDRIAAIVETAVGFIKEFSAAPVDTIDGYRQFEQAFRSYLMAQMGRLAFPLLRAIEINPLGSARVVEKRFQIDVEGGRMEASAISPEEQRAVRAIWSIQAIRSVDYRGLHDIDRERLDAIADLREDQLTDEIALELEELLLKSTPDHEIWATEEGRDRVAAYCLNHIVEETKRLYLLGYPGLEERDVTFLNSWKTDSVISPDDIAVAMRLLAKAAEAQQAAA